MANHGEARSIPIAVAALVFNNVIAIVECLHI